MIKKAFLIFWKGIKLHCSKWLTQVQNIHKVIINSKQKICYICCMKCWVRYSTYSAGVILRSPLKETHLLSSQYSWPKHHPTTSLLCSRWNAVVPKHSSVKTVWKWLFIHFWAHCKHLSLGALVRGGWNTALRTPASIWRNLHREVLWTPERNQQLQISVWTGFFYRCPFNTINLPIRDFP